METWSPPRSVHWMTRVSKVEKKRRQCVRYCYSVQVLFTSGTVPIPTLPPEVPARTALSAMQDDATLTPMKEYAALCTIGGLRTDPQMSLLLKVRRISRSLCFASFATHLSRSTFLVTHSFTAPPSRTENLLQIWMGRLKVG